MELPRMKAGWNALSDALTGGHGVKEKFLHLKELNSQKLTKENSSYIVQELQKRLGKMYPIAYLIHYRLVK